MAKLQAVIRLGAGRKGTFTLEKIGKVCISFSNEDLKEETWSDAITLASDGIGHTFSQGC